MKHNIRNFIVLLAAGALLTATPQGSSFLTEPTGQLVSAAVENHVSKKTTTNEASDDEDSLYENMQSFITNDSTVTSVGTFKTQDINGNEYTQDLITI